MSDTQATSADRWPLNESQRRALATTLAGIERDLQWLIDCLDHPPTDGRLVRYVDRPIAERAELQRLVTETQRMIAQIADELDLPAQEESLSRSLSSMLLLDEVGVEEVEPRRLRGYGEVDAATAKYLAERLPRLRQLLEELGALLNHPAGKAR